MALRIMQSGEVYAHLNAARRINQPRRTEPALRQESVLAPFLFSLFLPAALAHAGTPQTISFGALPDKAYDSAPFVVSATATSGLAVTFTAPHSIAQGANCTVSGDIVTITSQGGACNIMASQSGNATYSPAPSVTRSFNVKSCNYQIRFNALSNQPLGSAPFAVSTDVGFTTIGAIFSSLTPSVCTINQTAFGFAASGTVSLTASGTCTIRAASGPGTMCFPAPNVDQSFSATTNQTIRYLRDAAGNLTGIQRTFP